MSPSGNIKLTILSTLDNVPLLGASINKMCSLISMSEEQAFQMELCVVEACNNVIKHAYNNASDKEVEVEVRFFDDRIIFTICDAGTRKPTDLPHTLDYDPQDLDNLPEGRMGLFLIHEIMDEIHYEADGSKNIFTMTKFLSPKP
ncbi:MAG: ATP-binding protein [Bacteroidota bacterium]